MTETGEIGEMVERVAWAMALEPRHLRERRRDIEALANAGAHMQIALRRLLVEVEKLALPSPPATD